MIKTFILGIYSILLLFVGVLQVPMFTAWAGEKTLIIQSAIYAPLWRLQEATIASDGSHLIYRLDIQRLIYEIIILTLLAGAWYLLALRLEKRPPRSDNQA
ncbi:hypothetical protein ACFO4N_09065 [Camelliibacillus cellulosilyticus]|uniref:Uncharacterized protein n=1 Tax=Camelliibacillus cellulosilyticus TaxID=2174486 RepID=A0ABV9GKP6_9BACL